MLEKLSPQSASDQCDEQAEHSPPQPFPFAGARWSRPVAPTASQGGERGRLHAPPYRSWRPLRATCGHQPRAVTWAQVKVRLLEVFSQPLPPPRLPSRRTGPSVDPNDVDVRAGSVVQVQGDGPRRGDGASSIRGARVSASRRPRRQPHGRRPPPRREPMPGSRPAGRRADEAVGDTEWRQGLRAADPLLRPAFELAGFRRQEQAMGGVSGLL